MARPGYVHSSQKAGPYTPTRGRFAGTTFRSYRAYQNANAEAKGFRSAASRLASPKRIAKTDLGGMKKPSRIRALKALNRLRRGENIETAAREAGTTVANIKRYAGQAIRKGPRGRLVGAKFDSLPVVLNVSTEAGTIEVAVAGSRERVLVATYESALARFSRTGDVAELRRFRGRTVLLANGERVSLMTDPQTITRLLREGRISFDALYVMGQAA